MKKLTRREFLIKGTALIAGLSFGGTILSTEKGRALLTGHAGFFRRRTPVLVVVQLSGGNDGLNTVIPYGSGSYYDARPTIGYHQNEVLSLNQEIGLHPALTELQKLYQSGQLAIVQGVGYPKPDHSHFRSMDIWQTAEPDKLVESGWLGRYILSSSLHKQPLPAIQIGGIVNKSFLASGFNVPVIQSIEQFYTFNPKLPVGDKALMKQALEAIYHKKPDREQLRVVTESALAAFHNVEAIQSMTSSYTGKAAYPNTPFARDLQLTAKLISGKAGTRVFYAQLGGFDDHAQEKQQHAKTLQQLDSGLGAFFRDLRANGLHEDVVVMVFSEFGRRLKENGSGGTDHGTAAPVLVMGKPVKGGLYGAYPSLTSLDHGDLKYEVDFRSVYYTLIEDWLQGDAKATLGRTYEKLGFV